MIIVPFTAMAMTSVSMLLRTAHSDAFRLFDGHGVVSVASKHYSKANTKAIRSSIEITSNQEITEKQQNEAEEKDNSTTAAQQDLVLPSVLMIGAQKAGTTSVSYALVLYLDFGFGLNMHTFSQVAYWLIRNSCRPRVFSGESYFFGK